MLARLIIATAAVLAITAPASAHLDADAHRSLMAGVAHPLSGADHMLVMLAVGLWAATQGGQRPIVIPAAFLGTMIVGFAAALLGAPLPFVEPVILASIVLIGLMVALAMPGSVAGMTGFVAFFAFFHGHAHGGEIGAAGAMPFAAGFAIATVFLHALGIAAGLAVRRRASVLTRLAGAATALAGIWLAAAG